MNKRFNGKYEVYDGYAGGARPQHFSVLADEIQDDMSDEDLQSFFFELAEEAMRSTVEVCKTNHDEFIEWAREVLAKRAANAAADE